jgi:subtilisin family serine protease
MSFAAAVRVLFLILVAQGASAFDNAVAVRFAQGSALAESWYSQGRRGTLPLLETMVGPHNTESYLSPHTVRALTRDLRMAQLMLQQPSSDVVGALLNTAVIHSSIPAEKLVPLLLSIDGIDTAQTIPTYELLDVPNDPLVNDSYHHFLIQSFQAWQNLPSVPPTTVAIIDTGIELNHPDLRDVLWTNAGETGTDHLGRDRRSNGIDDDANGFVDDWIGWDFLGNGGRGDNSPLPGNAHGTHVAGIVGATVNNAIGGAGVSNNVRLMAIKVGDDDPSGRNVGRIADAVLYAVMNGARVINCSFGTPVPLFADVQAYQFATSRGAIIVAAAGNNGSVTALFPAALSEVVSVAATDANDNLVEFSNIHPTVTVCAPGRGIISTVLNGRFAPESGTSMSAPIVAGVAAMIRQQFPDHTPSQVLARLQATAKPMAPQRQGALGLYGAGRVDALRAVTATGLRWCLINDAAVTPSMTATTLRCAIVNQFTALQQARLVGRLTVAGATLPADVIDIPIGSLATLQRVDVGPLDFAVPIVIDFDVPMRLDLAVVDGNDTVGRATVLSTLNATWRTIRVNNIALTVTGTGNLAFRDFPTNLEGEGCTYRNGPNVLYEGALMVGTGPTTVSNAARSVPQQKDSSFTMTAPFVATSGPSFNELLLSTEYTDATDPSGVGVDVRQTAYQSTAETLRNCVILEYVIRNRRATTLSNLCAALFFDWDISAGGQQDGSAFLNKDGIAIVESMADPAAPKIGVAMASPLPLAVNIVDNDSRLTSEPGIYGGFPRSTKWFMMSRGVARTRSRITDVSMVIGAGPLTLAPQDSVRLTYVIGIGPQYADVKSAIDAGRAHAAALGMNAVPWTPLPTESRMLTVEGGTILTPGTSVLVRYDVHQTSAVRIELIDLSGRTISTLHTERSVPAGSYVFTMAVPPLASGMYAIRMVSPNTVSLLPVIIMN